LRAEPLVKCALQPVGATLPHETLDGLDVAPFASHRERDAGWDRLAVDQHCAGAALAAVTAGLDAGETGNMAKIVDQQQILRDGILMLTPIDRQPQHPLLCPRSCRLCSHKCVSPTTAPTLGNLSSGKTAVIFHPVAMTKIKALQPLVVGIPRP
jgi:hypothetical protein